MKRKSIRIYFGESTLLIAGNTAKGFTLHNGTLLEAKRIVESSRTPVRLCYKAASVESSWRRFRQLFGVVKAAGGLVKNPEGRYLLIFRRGKWDLPKGKLDKGERLRHCAIREVEEECNVSGLKITGLLPVTYHTYRHKGRIVLKETHWYRLSCSRWKNAKPQTEEDILEVKWMTRAQVRKAMKNSYASVRFLVEASVPGIKS